MVTVPTPTYGVTVQFIDRLGRDHGTLVLLEGATEAEAQARAERAREQGWSLKDLGGVFVDVLPDAEIDEDWPRQGAGL